MKADGAIVFSSRVVVHWLLLEQEVLVLGFVGLICSLIVRAIRSTPFRSNCEVDWGFRCFRRMQAPQFGSTVNASDSTFDVAVSAIDCVLGGVTKSSIVFSE